MSIDTTSTILTVLFTLAASILGFLQWRKPPRPRTQEALDAVQASSAVIDDALKIKDAYKDELANVRAEMAEFKKELAALRQEVKRIPELERENASLKEVNAGLKDEVEALRIRIRNLEKSNGSDSEVSGISD